MSKEQPNADQTIRYLCSNLVFLIMIISGLFEVVAGPSENAQEL